MLCVAGLVAVPLIGAGVLHLTLSNRVGEMQRMPDPFASLPAQERPKPPPEPGLTMLLAGIDSGINSSSTGASGQSVDGRSDALMLVRLTGDRRRAYVVSLPRDAWVNIPGRGDDKLNAAYAIGGPGLAIQTVEQLTGVRVDHMAVIDLAGFRELTDALGGVTITVPEDAYDPAQQVKFTAGTKRFNGETALQYVRQRHGLPRGDLDRVRRQQQFISALFDQIASGDTLSNPRRALAVFDAITKTTTVDSGFGTGEMMDLLFDFRKVQGNVSFMTVPVQGVGSVGSQSVVFLDKELGPAFWKAMGSDKLEDYLTTHGSTDVLSGPPR